MRVVLIAMIGVMLCSCVSKKKHLAALAVANQVSDSLQLQVDSTLEVIDTLRIRLAEQRGANEVLLITQDKLQDRIIALDDEIERLEDESASAAENLGGRLSMKEDTIQALRNQLTEIANTLEERSTALNTVNTLLLDTLAALDSTVYDLRYLDGSLSLSLSADFLFYSGSTTRLHTAGENALENISRVLTSFPQLEVMVVGHTDNSPLRRNSINNKWEFSSMRAATLVHQMTRQYELSTSRVIAAGKGDFAPRATNTTEAGRAQNNRMELLVYPAQKSLARDLRRKLEK